MVNEALNEIKSESKVLVLLEDEEQVKDYLGREGQIPGKKKLIALSPFAMYELDRRNIPYRIIEDCYDPEELYALGIGNYSKVEELCNLIDSHIHKKFQELKELGIKPAFFSIRHLKTIYDSATIRLFQLSKLIDSENPDIVVVYQSKHFPLNPEMGVQSLFPNNQESIYSRLLELQGWRVKIAMLPETSIPGISEIETANVNIAQRLKDMVLKRIQNRPVLYEFAVAFKKLGLKAVLNKLKETILIPAGDPVLLYGGGYNWDYCRSDLKNARIAPVIRAIDDQRRWLDSVSADEKKQLSAVWNELKTDDEFRGFFLWGKIDFFPLMEERLGFIVERIAPACLRSYEEAESMIKDKKIKALLASTFVSCFGHSFSQAAHKANIPVFSWQHGAYGAFPHPIITYTDFIAPDIHFVFGEGVIKQHLEDASRFKTRLVALGSTALESIYDENLNHFAEKKKENKVVLYITSALRQNMSYISENPPFSDNYFWNAQKRIVTTIGRHIHHKVIIKLHPSLVYREPPIREYVKDRNFINVKILKDQRSVKELLRESDVILLDLPSTTLLQSLTTTKPIFVYTGHLHIDRVALEMLKKRVYCYLNLDEFLEALNDFLSGKHIGKVDYDNTEFLEYYGMYKLDGKSGERAAKIVKKVIEEGIESVST